MNENTRKGNRKKKLDIKKNKFTCNEKQKNKVKKFRAKINPTLNSQ